MQKGNILATPSSELGEVHKCPPKEYIAMLQVYILVSKQRANVAIECQGDQMSKTMD